MKRLSWFFKKPPYLWEDRPIIRQKKQRKYDIRFIWFAWIIIVILALAFGIFAGHSVTAANKDTEIMDLQTQLETANASLAEVNVELAFWQNEMKALAEGGQFEGVDTKTQTHEPTAGHHVERMVSTMRRLIFRFIPYGKED